MEPKTETIVTVENSKKLIGIHFTTKHGGKMAGIQSLSTSCLCNKFCKQRINNDNLVCSHCYANTQMKMYPNMKACLKQNTEILTGRILAENEIPLINATYFRFESFGDIQNVTQVINYFNICKKNPDAHFALWTKNPWIIKETLKETEKPDNLQIVLSSPYLNKQIDIEKWNFVDKVFTVYDKEHIKLKEININCGAKSCLKCHQCYVKSETVYINEKLK